MRIQKKVFIIIIFRTLLLAAFPTWRFRMLKLKFRCATHECSHIQVVGELDGPKSVQHDIHSYFKDEA